jgi:hypothetical protein
MLNRDAALSGSGLAGFSAKKQRVACGGDICGRE